MHKRNNKIYDDNNYSYYKDNLGKIYKHHNITKQLTRLITITIQPWRGEYTLPVTTVAKNPRMLKLKPVTRRELQSMDMMKELIS